MAEKKLSKSERKAIEADWFERMPKQLNEWLASLPEALQKQLDYSPESLLALQEYLWEKYDDIPAIEHPKNQKEAEAAGYYYGETYRKHMPMELHWEAGDILDDSDISPMLLANNEYINAWTDIFRQLAASVAESQRSESELLWYFNGGKEVYQRKIDNNERVENLAPIVPGRGGYSYQYFLLQTDKQNLLPKIEKLLKQYFSSENNPAKASFYNDNHLLINMEDDYYFHLTHSSNESIREEIQEMAQDYNGEIEPSKIAQCQSRLEFWGDEDSDLDYMNDALWILQEISELPEIITILDVKTGEELTFN